MNTLVNLFGITIEFSTFIAFFVGIGIGFLLLLLVYLYAVLRSINKDLKLNKVQEEDIDEEEIKWMIQQSQKEFKDKELREQEGYGNLLLRQLKELTNDIAKKFYPESPYPYLELTIDESIALVHYITNRIDEMTNTKILRLFRPMTLRRIAELNNTKTKIEESRVVKAAKKHGIAKVATSTLKVINAISPFHWFKRVTFDKAVGVILVKIGLALIAITGEETYKIYSKKVFDKDVELETSVEDIYNEIKNDMENIEKEEVNNE